MPTLIPHEVDNPHGLTVPDVRVVRGEIRHDPAQVTVMRSIRGDPLGWLHSHKDREGNRLIDEAQYRAGRVLQGYLEAREIGGLKSTHPTCEAVDCSHNAAVGLTERQQAAYGEIMSIIAALGLPAYRLLYLFLGERKFIKDIARINGDATKWGAEKVGQAIRGSLTELAKHLGFA